MNKPRLLRILAPTAALVALFWWGYSQSAANLVQDPVPHNIVFVTLLLTLLPIVSDEWDGREWLRYAVPLLVCLLLSGMVSRRARALTTIHGAEQWKSLCTWAFAF